MLELSLVVRWAHVAAATVAVGGTVAMAVAAAGVGPARRYEWAFWAALGILVATGIGLVAQYGAGLPTADTTWGRAFTLKMATVGLLAVVSMMRALYIARAAARGGGAGNALRSLYAFAASLGVLAVGLAQVLAHG